MNLQLQSDHKLLLNSKSNIMIQIVPAEWENFQLNV